jgi:hypothetical protein
MLKAGHSPHYSITANYVRPKLACAIVHPFRPYFPPLWYVLSCLTSTDHVS